MKFKKFKKKSKILTKARIIAKQVLESENEYKNLSIEDLKIRTDYLVDGLKNQKFTLDDIVVDALSIAREIIYRVHGMLAYEVQMMGSYVVHSGDFAEMYTGEGKSLTILLVAFLNALSKKGVHIVTVNEYLVQRDAEFARIAFEQLGITVGYNTSELSKEAKKEMFNKDITYTTNSELGFDYLKDNMVKSIDEKVIRHLNFVIIDEADSVLIDEARTPLIISGQPKEDLSFYIEIDNLVSKFNESDYVIDSESNTISLTDSGVKKAEDFFKLDNLYSVESAEIVHKITNALTAHFVFANGREYLVKNDKIYLIDQFTGRVLEGRSYNAGLQQAIQAKERVKIEPENVVMATITYQSFFRLYEKLSGVSGTAMTESEEFLKIYNMVVVRIPTNKPIIRIDKQDYIFGSKKVKWDHIIAEIVERNKTGQPILVGTASVTDSEIIHQRLKELNIDHQVLNARDNSKEAEIVKNAGSKFAITISTNMAGRGTDIKVSDEIKKIGGLYVIGTERHESRRIDNQLRGRTGRQGDPGESRFFTSLEDSLFKRFATDRFEKASAKLQEEFYDSKFFSRMLDRTQKKVEGLNFDIRKNLMDYDHVLSLQRELIYKQRDQILLKNKNFEIINNMINDYSNVVLSGFKNQKNSSLVESRKLANFINEKILKFNFFDFSIFENQTLLVAYDKFILILKKVFEIKWSILQELNAINVIDEILLTFLDQYWTIHIDKMTKLREGVNLRSLEQRSPLNIYIEDGNTLFEKMKSDVVINVINQIFEISLPNQEIILQEELRNLLNSDDFKKSYYNFDQKEIDQNLNNKLENFNSQKKTLSEQEEFDKFAQISKEDLSDKQHERLSVDEVKKIVQDTLESHQIIQENDQENSIEAIEAFSNNENDWIESEQVLNNTNNSKDSESDSELKKLSNEEIQEIIDNPSLQENQESTSLLNYLNDVLNSSVNQNDTNQYNISNSDILKSSQQNIPVNLVQDSIPDESLKDFQGEQIIDNVAILKSISDLQDKSNPELNQNQPVLNKKMTLSQLKQNDLQDLRNNIKETISKNIFNSEEFKKYKQGFFIDQKNRINYDEFSDVKKMYENNVVDNTGVIQEFYKTPYVEKRKKGHLFGYPIKSKYDKPLPVTATFEDYIKSKNEIAASEEQLNNLLFVDDERSRLMKINNTYNDKYEEFIFEKKLEQEIENEPEINDNKIFENKKEQEKLENKRSIFNKKSRLNSDDLIEKNYKKELIDLVNKK